MTATLYSNTPTNQTPVRGLKEPHVSRSLIIIQGQVTHNYSVIYSKFHLRSYSLS